MPYNDFVSNANDALSLLDIADHIDDDVRAQLICRSYSVLIIAYWQNYNEKLLAQFSEVLRQRAKSGENLPSKVRREIGKWVLRKENIYKHPEKTASLIWEYASGSWRDDYGKFVKDQLSKFNTPNSTNLITLYQSILGIENINQHWSDYLHNRTATQSLEFILETRHEIAHGVYDGVLNTNDLRRQFDFLLTIANDTYTVSSDHIVEILKDFGNHWNLNSFNLIGLIQWLSNLPEPRSFAVRDLAEINRKWYSNHRKLGYSVWDFLQGPSSNRSATEKFERFLAGEIQIPYEIISFGGNDAIAKPGTRMIYFDDLNDLIRN